MGSKAIIGGALAGPTGALLGSSNPVTKALGISGDQGAYYTPDNELSTTALQEYKDAISRANNNPIQDYRNTLGLAPGAAHEDVAKSLGIGQDYLSQLQGEQKRLADEGYGLTQNDREAYGQASGDIARLFGQQEQNLSQSLADRGLGGAFSGVGASQFSGLLGNKNEQLAKAQQAIAQNRMQMNQQRLAQTRNFLSQLSGQRTGLLEGQTDRNLNKEQNLISNRGNAAQIAAGMDTARNAQQQASMEDQRGAKGKGLLDALGGGLMSSTYNIGAAPGSFAQSTAGAGGKAAGGQMFSGGGGGGTSSTKPMGGTGRNGYSNIS